MSKATPLLKYYNNKINIYDNDNFIPLPNWVTCPAPSMEIIKPAIVEQTPCGPMVIPLSQPLNPVGSYYVYSSNLKTSGCKPCQSCG